jgi:hypothetical protein
MILVFISGGAFGFLLGLVWHWYNLTHWSARIREANGGKIPGYDDEKSNG